LPSLVRYLASALDESVIVSQHSDCPVASQRPAAAGKLGPIRTKNSGPAQFAGIPLIWPLKCALPRGLRPTGAESSTFCASVPGLHTRVPVTWVIGPGVPLLFPPINDCETHRRRSAQGRHASRADRRHGELWTRAVLGKCRGVQSATPCLRSRPVARRPNRASTGALRVTPASGPMGLSCP
jgi:hypothetical protein